jgi:O-acetyl-ADP-ribose deacetylase (regulator of RNase III)
MPFGERQTADGKPIDFDKVYDYFLKPIIEALGLNCVRCDKIGESGWIHAKMFEHIYESDVALVDITTLNPNVFYELGVRHSLAPSVTVLIKRRGTNIPFNIQGFQVVDYDEDFQSIEEAKKKISDVIRNGLKLKKKDSPVHEVLNLRIGTNPKPIPRTEIFRYGLNGLINKHICLITGDLRHVRNIDVWVNSENTNMEMARHFDKSISSVIRYCGAKKDQAKRIVEDTIAKELLAIVGPGANIPAGNVIVTSAGELERSHQVKKIFHAAAVTGEPGKGYSPIQDIGQCVRSALELMDSEDMKNANLKSILFPLMGTGTGRGEVEAKAEELLVAAIAYLQSRPESQIENVYFLTWSEEDLAVCQRILQRRAEVTLS